jgi:O-antigen ligase
VTDNTELKYRSGEGGKTRRRPLRTLEWITAIHLGIFVIAATWAFGGQSDWVRPPLVAWGSLSALITLAIVLEPKSETSHLHFPIWWALPIILFNALVLIATLHPNFREIKSGNESMLVEQSVSRWFPSSARPALARDALWSFDAIWLSCFNLGLVVRRRRTIRILLLGLIINGIVLAVFGSVQKLSGSAGLFFGAVPSPQKYFFSSFVYHNHWGAYVVLTTAASFGIIRYYVRHQTARDFFHSPALMGGVAILILLATIPLSSSRSCTVLAIILLGIAFISWLVGLFRKRRHFHESIALPISLALCAATVSAFAIWSIARDTIQPRIALTVQQLNSLRSTATPDARSQLYHDTFRMAQAKPLFGWGMASYPHVFTLYNTRESRDRLPVFYHDAHSDWLQALAEHGVLGSALLLLGAILPLVRARSAIRTSEVSVYLLTGCILIAIYAAVEFPFGNFAVVLMWWLCFYSAVHYGELTANRDRAAS